jgi:hypothetical protein
MSRAETIDKGHGRIETRMIAVRTKLPVRLDTIWPGVAQIVRIERRRELKTLCQRQVIYAFTSLPPERYDAEKLLALSRDHWQIENRLFHVRDITFREDACRVRTGNAPSAVAHLREAALTIIRKRKLKPRPAREAFAANPKAAIRLLIRS